MCLITVKPAGVHLSEDEIRYDYMRNPHGAGFMYAKDGLVHWEKGFFSPEALIKRWNEVVSDGMAAALHTRIATHGEHTASLCHPFPLDGSDVFQTKGSAPLAMMHNGIIPDESWAKWFRKGDSDTSAFARRLVPILGNKLPSDKLATNIDEHIGGSRMLFMAGDGQIKTIGTWHEEGGLLFSNRGYLGTYDALHWGVVPNAPYGRQSVSSGSYVLSDWDAWDDWTEEDDAMELADSLGYILADEDMGIFHGARQNGRLYFADPSELGDPTMLPLYWFDPYSFNMVRDDSVWFEPFLEEVI